MSSGSGDNPVRRSAEPGPDACAFVAIGSNLGASESILQRAVQRLQGLSCEPLRVSSFWCTTPVDCPPGSRDFLNAVVQFLPLPGETPVSLLHKLQALEKEFGRAPKQILNEPRPLDLDLITFAGETIATEHLTLPHPRAARRRFVLEGLCEIAPQLVLPGQHATVAELLRACPEDPGMRKVVSTAA
jgi:2-amino-4-hydroxy-6-hydroxymethyldihydropteridine diphosphokinase